MSVTVGLKGRAEELVTQERTAAATCTYIHTKCL